MCWLSISCCHAGSYVKTLKLPIKKVKSILRTADLVHRGWGLGGRGGSVLFLFIMCQLLSGFADSEAIWEESQVPVWRIELWTPHHPTKRRWPTQEEMICVTYCPFVVSVICSLVVAASALSIVCPANFAQPISVGGTFLSHHVVCIVPHRVVP